MDRKLDVEPKFEGLKMQKLKTEREVMSKEPKEVYRARTITAGLGEDSIRQEEMRREEIRRQTARLKALRLRRSIPVEFRRAFSVTKSDAKSLGIPFTLTLDQFYTLWTRVPGQWENRGRKRDSYRMVRIDNTAPISTTNVVIMTVADALKGNKHNTGKKFSAASRAKVSATKLGVPLSEEHRIAIGRGLPGRKLSDEHKQRISAGRRRKFLQQQKDV